jgi:uncharacterized protein (DUF2141 family)
MMLILTGWSAHEKALTMKRLLMFLILTAAVPQAALAGSLTVQVDGVRSTAGRVMVAVCEKRYFLKPHCPIENSAAPDPKGVSITFPDVAPGRYAVLVAHDLNGNGKLDMSFLFIPKEPYGLSGAKGGPPRFEAAAVAIGPGPKTIIVELR